MSSRLAFTSKHALVVVMSVLSMAAARAESSADASITMRAETALHTALGTRASAVVVDTRHGYVTLHGKVKRQGVIARAAEQVWRVQGVSGVRNLLQVVGSGETALVQRRDDVVKADILRMLRADRSLDDSRITVRSVSNGVVLLSGDASSLGDDIRALRATAGRPGVRRVFSEIEATAPDLPGPVPLLATGR
jgi:hyperosmotically inducible protein